MLLAIVIPVALFWFFFLSGRLEEIKNTSDKISKLRQELVDLEAMSMQLPKLEEELNIMEGCLQKALKLLPEKKDIPAFLPEISSLGNEARLNFLSFDPQKEQIEAFYAAIPIQMEFNGPFHNTVDFFDNVSRMSRIVHIKSVSMGEAKQITNVWSLKGSADSDQKTGTPDNTETIQESGEGLAEDTGIKRSSSWIINTRCEAVTYRFLSPEEQQAQKEKEKGKRR